MQKVRLLFILAVIIMAFFIIPVTYAKTATKGLAVSPIRTEIELAPGDVVNRTLQVTNYSGSLMVINVDAEAFNVVNAKYDYSFDEKSDIAKWVTFDKSVVQLQPGKSGVVSYNVNVPKNAEPGGRYLSIFASTDPQTAPGELLTEQRIASLVYITVKGKVTRAGTLQSFSSPYIFDGYQPWKLSIKNSGTAHFRSTYTASVRSIFDGKEVASMTDSSLILPGTMRDVTAPMPALKYLGVYKAVYTVGLGDKPAATREAYMIFVPKQLYVPLMTLSIIIIGGLGYGGWKIIQRQKSKMAN